MRARMSRVAAMLLIAAVASPLMAAPEKAKKEKKAPKATCPSAKIVKNVKLTDAQKAEIKKITAKHKGALKVTKVGFTAEQRKARAEAVKKAKADGKKGKDLKAAADAAAKITDEQKKAAKEASKKAGAARKEYRVAILAVLTDKQKASLKGARKPKGEKTEKKPKAEKKPKDGAKKVKKEKKEKKPA